MKKHVKRACIAMIVTKPTYWISNLVKFGILNLFFWNINHKNILEHGHFSLIIPQVLMFCRVRVRGLTLPWISLLLLSVTLKFKVFGWFKKQIRRTNKCVHTEREREHAWDSFEITWHLREIFLSYLWDMFEICLSYCWYKPEIQGV